MEGFGKVVAWLGSFWVQVDTPPLLSAASVSGDDLSRARNDPSAEVDFLISHLWFWTMCLAVLSVLIGAGRMIWEHHGGPGKELIKSLIVFSLVTGGGVIAIQILVVAGDEFAKWVLDEATDGAGFGTNLTGLIGLSLTLGPLLIIIFGVVAILIAASQMVMMVFRSAMLVVLAGFFPTISAFTNTEMGKQWWGRAVGWLIAFILYKPVAALIYAAAFKLTSANVWAVDGEGGVKLIAGLSLMAAAVAALPALMRFVTPAVGAAAGGAGGGATFGALSGTLATGAINGGVNMNSTRSGGGGGSSSRNESLKTDSAATGAKHAASTSSSDAAAAGKAPPSAAGGAAASGAAAGGTGAAAGAGGAAAGGGGAAAAGASGGPVGAIAVVGAQVLKTGADTAAGAVRGATEGATDGATGEPSGSK